MSDSLYVRNFVGGDLPPNKWDDFWLNASTIGWEEITLNKGVLMLGGEFNCGNYEEILALCRKFGLQLQSLADGKYEYNPAVTVWRPGMSEEETWSTNHDGVPVASLRDFEDAVNRDAMSDLLSKLRTFAETPTPLTVGGKPITAEMLEG